MKVLVSGSTGLIGSGLVPALRERGDHVVRLVRMQPRDAQLETHWDPAAGRFDAGAAGGADAAVHLCGESIGAGRWTAARKQRIHDSRVRSTRFLAQQLLRLERPPKTLVCASATGWYGDRGDELLDESSAPGSGFLADLCRDWEAAADPARREGLRVVHLRTGVVLSGRGGALVKMLPPFRFGLGGKLGHGRQYFSWISFDDIVGVILRVLAREHLSGAINAVAPAPVTNAEFTRVLGRVLGRPTVLPVPALALRLLLGGMADETLLASTRVRPRVLLDDGFRFRHPEVESALRSALGREPGAGGPS